MILKTSNESYIDIDSIRAIRMVDSPKGRFGIVVLDGEKLAFWEDDMNELEEIKAAFLWQHGNGIYDTNKKKIK